MSKSLWPAVLAVVGLLALAPVAPAQTRPYVGYVYPAGGQQGTTFEVKVGGQNLNDIQQVIVSGSGVTARLVEYCFPLGNRESGWLIRQLAELKKSRAKSTSTKRSKGEAASSEAPKEDPATTQMIARIERLIREDMRFPACSAFRGVAFIEVTIDANAPPGQRELRLVTLRGGASNPMVFHVGQVPEYARRAMKTAPRQILGREASALRTRPESEAEQCIDIPCPVNGQIASGEVHN